ncbi:MAG TPA: TraR/DksA C4-type zinc finger protein [Actinomycetota bacterium]|nr:TraR/DksA C4-type zinc finger protein [Actinomycetota bacterium]
MTSIDHDEARTLLLEEQERLQLIRNSLAQEPVDGLSERDALGEISFADQHPADVASETFEREKDVSILGNVDEQLRDVEGALKRLDDGTYGRCEICGKDIGDERLRARPEARYCVDDQARVERGVA